MDWAEFLLFEVTRGEDDGAAYTSDADASSQIAAVWCGGRVCTGTSVYLACRSLNCIGYSDRGRGRWSWLCSARTGVYGVLQGCHHVSQRDHLLTNANLQREAFRRLLLGTFQLCAEQEW